ncbi:MAG: hypothetical protein JRN39_05180 [Nitrososphaerota archaeon]|nr:hypothetical protein [Nitrososphaerota archaeon]
MTSVVLFQAERDSLWPLSLTRPSHSLQYGFRPISSYVKHALGAPEAALLPGRLAAQCREREPGLSVNPERLEGEALLVNGAIRPTPDVLERAGALGPGQFLDSGGEVAAARVASLPEGVPPTPEALKKLGCEGLRSEGSLLSGPWELVQGLGARLEGKGVVYGSSVQVEDDVVFDTARGPVLVADGARIEAFSRIEGPSLIGRGSVIHSARINGHTAVGEQCRVGGEVEWSIVSSFTNKAHFGYVGHSFVGEWVNMGAGCVTSDLKNTYGPIRVERGGTKVDTGMVKLGCFVGDYAKVSINAMLYAGRSVGVASHVHGLVSEDVPPFVVYGRSTGMGVGELSLEKALETARRMKSRRDRALTAAEEETLRLCFEQTAAERAAAVVVGKR